MNCQKVAEVEESYLAGELNEATRTEVEQHLQQCKSCARRLSGYEEMLGRMFGSLAPVAPSLHLRSSLLAQVKPGRPAPVPLRRPVFRLGWVYGLAAALVMSLSLWSFSLLGQLQEAKTVQAEAQRILTLTSAPDSFVWAMLSPDQPSGPTLPRARMYARPDSDLFLVTAANLRPAPAAQVYWMWYVRGTRPVSGGALQPDSVGNATLRITDPTRTPGEINTCFITLEKAGSEPTQPAAPPLLQWRRA